LGGAVAGGPLQAPLRGAYVQLLALTQRPFQPTQALAFGVMGA
jgi:hypothetical protein